jgi:hypothetical protein
MTKKLGIIQSRGLGDIVIALPIAKFYHDQGYEIYWPICEEFIPSVKTQAAWVNWLAVKTDKIGHFFLDEPLRLLKAQGITEPEDQLYLYQFLNSRPDLTDPDYFAMMKFDQYKYAQAGVPFRNKWLLNECITRDTDREQKLYEQVVKQPRYMVYQQQSSDVKYEIDLSIVDDPDIQKIEITALTDNIWDWLKIIEGAELMILIDSVYANIVDQLNLNPSAEKYYMRKWNRSVDGNPVLLQNWYYLPVTAPNGERVTSLTDLIGKPR